MRIVPDDCVCLNDMENLGHHDHTNQDSNVFNVVLLTKKIRIIVITFQEVVQNLSDVIFYIMKNIIVQQQLMTRMMTRTMTTNTIT